MSEISNAERRAIWMECHSWEMSVSRDEMYCKLAEDEALRRYPDPKPMDWASRAKEAHPEINADRLRECAQSLRSILLSEPWETAGTIEWLSLRKEILLCERDALREKLLAQEYYERTK